MIRNFALVGVVLGLGLWFPVQATPSEHAKVDKHAKPDPSNQATDWYVRLIAKTLDGAYRDGNSALGQLQDSVDGRDGHDLPERAPFGSPYLTVLFPHPEWGADAGDYASDFRALNRGKEDGEWTFEIHSDLTGEALRLSWEGPDDILGRSVLVDVDTGQEFAASDPSLLAQGVPVQMDTPVRRFAWQYSAKAKPPGKKDKPKK